MYESEIMKYLILLLYVPSMKYRKKNYLKYNKYGNEGGITDGLFCFWVNIGKVELAKEETQTQIFEWML